MSNKHSNFKKFNKLFISAVAIILAICMLPSQAFAADITIGTSSSPVYGNGGQGAGSVTSYKGNTNACNTTSQLYLGYRMYMVDNEGNVIKDDSGNPYVTDVLMNNINPSRTGTIVGGTLRVNKSKISLKNSEGKVEIPTKHIKDIDSNLPKPYQWVNGTMYTNGDNLKAWMTAERNDIYRINGNYVIYKLWGNKALEEYIANGDYYLVVESLFQCHLWTSWKNIEYSEEDHGYNIEHAKYELGYSEIHIDKTRQDTIRGMMGAAWGSSGYANCVNVTCGNNTNELKCSTGTYIHNFDVCCAKNYRDRFGYHRMNCSTCDKQFLFTGEQMDKYDEMLLNKYGIDVSSYPITTNEYGTAGHNCTTLKCTKTLKLNFNHQTTEQCRICDGVYACGVLINSSGTQYKECTNTLFYDTYYGWLKNYPTELSNAGIQPYSKNYLYWGGNTLLLERDEDNLGLKAAPKSGNSYVNCKSYTNNTVINNKYGYGMHLYRSSEMGNGGDPIHTKDPVDPTPSNPNDPTPPEEPSKTTPPSEPFDNTGSSTIIKVYGEIYKDGSTVYHIDHKATYSETQTTDWIVIEDESKYKLQQWVVSGGTPDTDYTTTEWLNTDGTYSFDKSTLFTNNSAGYKLTYTAEDNFKIGEGKTIYLLYLKTITPLETSKDKVPNDKTQYQPNNPTYPENPYNPIPQPDKQGGYNIIKVYTLLDEYNGTPLSSETYIQTQTTPFIEIESESTSNWKLAHWYTTSTTNPDVTASNFLQPIDQTNQSQVNTLLEQGYYLLPTPTSIGNPLSHGNQPTTKYFTDSSTTVYLIFTRTTELGGDANYEAGTYYIPESYLSKAFSTAGQALTITTQSGTITEEFCEHIFSILNPAFNKSAPYTDKTVTARITSTLAAQSTTSSIFQDSCYVINIDNGNNTPYYYTQYRQKSSTTSEAMSFNNMEFRFSAYRLGDSVTLAKWKIDSSKSYLEAGLLDTRKNNANNINSLTADYFKVANTNSVRTATNPKSESPINFNINTVKSDLETAISSQKVVAQLQDIRGIDTKLKVEASVYAGQSTVAGTPVSNKTQIHTSTTSLGKNIYIDGLMLNTPTSSSSNIINFTPYIKMQFENTAAVKYQVYAMGKYSRQLKVNEYAGIKFTAASDDHSIINNGSKAELGKIQLNSNQWSTHATAIANVGKDCVLPGGATLNMSVPQSNRNKLTVETYYPILSGSGLQQIHL